MRYHEVDLFMAVDAGGTMDGDGSNMMGTDEKEATEKYSRYSLGLTVPS